MTKTVKQIRVMLVLAAGVFVGVGSLESAEAKSEAKSGPRFQTNSAMRAVPGEFILKLKAPVSSAELERLRGRIVRAVPSRERGGAQAMKLQGLAGASSFALMHAHGEMGHRLREFVTRDPLVEYVEPNFIYKTFGLPSDPEFRKSWSLHNTGQAVMQIGKPGADVHITELWDRGVTGSSSVVVAVIDTGVDWSHPDLAANIYTNPGESGDLATNGIDDDQNGYIDDVHGWNSLSENGDSRDDADHGTHVAGIIGALGNNSEGSVGIAWNVSLLPVKFMDRDGYGTTADAIEAIEYARKMKVKIMNNSWGGDPYSQALHDVIEASRKDGILFVAAAGNNTRNNDQEVTYPAGYEISNVISVGATDNRDAMASISNFGVRTVDVAAPGLLIYSTIPGGGYDSFTGTSMAAPHVAGIAALMLAVEPGLAPEEIIDRLVATSDQNYELKRKVRSKGRVNAFNAVFNIVPPSLDPDESLWQDHAFRLESEHPYKSAFEQRVPVKIPGAKFIRLRFQKIETEEFDRIFIETPEGVVVETLSGNIADYLTESVKGDTLVLRFKTDLSLEKFGFVVDGAQVVW